MAKDKDVTVQKSADVAPQRVDAQIERWFDDFFNRRWLRPFDWPAVEQRLGTQTPRVDVVERDGELLVRAELPGMSKDDIDVSVSDNSITVKGSSRKEEKQEDGDYHRREIVSSYVSRTVPLPCEVDGDRAKAQIRDGLLEVTLPKAEKARRKRIAVES